MKRQFDETLRDYALRVREFLRNNANDNPSKRRDDQVRFVWRGAMRALKPEEIEDDETLIKLGLAEISNWRNCIRYRLGNGDWEDSEQMIRRRTEQLAGGK